MQARAEDLAEVIRNVVAALDEVDRDLRVLGRNPVEVRHAKDSLQQLEFQLLGEIYDKSSDRAAR